ncbi:hypothetical protein FQB35_07855 [Crassaminicella thermophila]|uniref:CBS domain-containing protein n=1 Tax=Crassaminicella thermophila TaxID=2599308 RepID=A0A5C0SEY2_CRATE|nr:site-2 protease family protein [Crassaminicella thermophila]QEK12297.1 hypothetical protein FQB35_07855 [Crassaminicella thermophila]
MRLMRLCEVDIKMNMFLCIFFVVFFVFGYIKYLVIAFFVILLHEGAHVYMGNLLGYKINSIEIFPFGGVVRMEADIAINPQHEIMIAISGPILNLIMVFLGYYILNIFQLSNEKFLFFIYSNLSIGIFNLLPILPLDGGRIGRAYLAYFIGFKKSTKFVVILSKVISCVLFLYGCYAVKYNKFNIYILLLAIFLYIAAHKEYKMAAFIFIKEVTQKRQHLLCNGVLNTKYLIAVKNTPIKDVMNQFVPRKYHIVTVMDADCKIIGVLTENDVLNGLVKYGLNASLEKLLKSG